MTSTTSQSVSRTEFYATAAVLFVALVAIHHAPRAPVWIQHVLTAVLILAALIAMVLSGIAWCRKPDASGSVS